MLPDSRVPTRRFLLRCNIYSEPVDRTSSLRILEEMYSPIILAGLIPFDKLRRAPLSEKRPRTEPRTWAIRTLFPVGPLTIPRSIKGICLGYVL